MEIDEIVIEDVPDGEINANGDNVVYKVENDYEKLKNQPSVNGTILIGNRTLEDLGIKNDKNYFHIQEVASDEWIINHNLNKYPAVSIIDSAENEVVGEVEYVDNNNLKIKFAGSFSGKATLN